MAYLLRDEGIEASDIILDDAFNVRIPLDQAAGIPGLFMVAGPGGWTIFRVAAASRQEAT